MWFRIILKMSPTVTATRPLSCPNLCSRTTERACTRMSASGRKLASMFKSRRQIRRGVTRSPICHRWHLKTLQGAIRITNPTTNSYKHFGARVSRLPSIWLIPAGTAISHPHVLFVPEGQADRIRDPDPSCNGYLAFSAVLMVSTVFRTKIRVIRSMYNLPARRAGPGRIGAGFPGRISCGTEGG